MVGSREHPWMGRRKVNFEQVAARFPDGTLAGIDAVLRPGENRSDLIRIAVQAEVEKRAQEAKKAPDKT